MRIDMKRIEAWLEETILYYLNQRNGRLHRRRLVTSLTSDVSRNWHWGPLIQARPDWACVSDRKRQLRVDKVINRMCKEHKLKVCNAGGDERKGEAAHDYYIHSVGLLDRIARSLEDDNGPQV